MDLSLILLEDILNELKKRHEAYIFSYVNTLDKNDEEVIHQFHGGKTRCIGLAEQLKHGLLNDFDEDNTN